MICIGIVSLYCGGSGKTGFYNDQEAGLARAFSRLGFSCVVFKADPSISAISEELKDGIRFVRVPAENTGIHGRFDWNVISGFNVDVVQLNADNQLWAPELLKFCRKNDLKAYCYIGTVSSDSHNPVKKFLMDIAFRRNIREYKKVPCFAKTPFVADELKRMGVTGVRLAPVGIDTEFIPDISEDIKDRSSLRSELGIPVDKKVLLFVGRIEEYKRPMQLVGLLRGLPESCFLVVIGTGSLDGQLQSALEREGLSDRVLWIKKIPNVEIHKFYAAVDCFVNLNDREIFGMSILEAMYQGCTVIARHAPGPDLIIEDGVSGFLADDVEQMREIILSDRRIDPGVARERIEKCFVWDSTAGIICGSGILDP